MTKSFIVGSDRFIPADPSFLLRSGSSNIPMIIGFNAQANVFNKLGRFWYHSNNT
jgi:hypothetical protein